MYVKSSCKRPVFLWIGRAAAGKEYDSQLGMSALKKHSGKRKAAILLLIGCLLLLLSMPVGAVTSSFTVSGANHPVTLAQGQSFSITGTVTSAAELKTVTVGVVSDATGKWVDTATYAASPNAKTFDIAAADESVRFGSLPAGTYTYRIAVKDANGTSKYLMKEPFTVTGSGGSSAASSSLTLSGANYPTSLVQGGSFAVAGTITSAVTIRTVTVGVVSDATGKWVSSATYSNSNVNAKSFNVTSADASIQFGSLPAGSYSYRIAAKDANGTSKYLLNKPFTVTASSDTGQTASFSISGETYPVSLKQGQSFSLKGTVTSAALIRTVTVGVVSDATGKWVSGATYSNSNVNAKTFNVADADADVNFGSLPAGTYTYRIAVKDANGKSAYVLKKAFSVTAGSSFSIAGAAYPASLKQGQSFSISGTVTSAVELKTVTVGVVSDATGKWVDTATYAASPNAKTFDVAAADPYIVFGSLPAGSYTYRIAVKDANGTSAYVLKKAFTVTASGSSSAFTISGANYPTTLSQGGSYSLKGKVTSVLTLDCVTVGVVSDATGKWVSGATYKTSNIRSKTFDIATADPHISFGSLPAGTYTYRVAARDTSGTTQYVLKKPFTVTAVSGTAGATILPYNAALIKAIGKQPYSGPCGIYSMAYARAVIDGAFPLNGYDSYQARIIKEYGLGSSYAYWSRAGGTLTKYSTESSLYKAAFSQIAAGKPCIINCYNPQTGNNHFVLAIGYVKGTTKTNVSLNSFIVLDPATGTQRLMSGTGYQTPVNSPYGPELVTF